MNRILDRLSIPGILCLVIGILFCLAAQKRMDEKVDKRFILLTAAGMILAVFGALVLLDLIPGM